MVSQASSFLTRFWSLSIFFTEKARESVTLSGRPSGMATTSTVIPIRKNSISSFKCLLLSHLRSWIRSTLNLLPGGEADSEKGAIEGSATGSATGSAVDNATGCATDSATDSAVDNATDSATVSAAGASEGSHAVT